MSIVLIGFDGSELVTLEDLNPNKLIIIHSYMKPFRTKVNNRGNQLGSACYHLDQNSCIVRVQL